MEPKEVFVQFLKLCDNRIGFLQNDLASNSVLEWFGRTIRGSHRINNYYRYDLSQQYKHHFENVQQCEAFETKPSHFQTKQIPTSDVKSQKNPIKKSEPITFMEFKTPEQNRNSPELPKLHQGRLFRPMTDDLSDDELSELGLSGIEEAVTPSKTVEPSEKKTKKDTARREKNTLIQDGSDSDMISNDGDEVRLEQTNEQCGTSLMCEMLDDGDSGQSSNASDEMCSKDNSYSDLMYLEAIGKLRIIKRAKHRGVRNSSISSDMETTTNGIEVIEDSPTSSSSWDRKTRLKISYRINKIDNGIQFALIIYERVTLNSIVRRNLIDEFEKVEDIDDDQIAKELKRKIPKKRALRL